MLLFGHRFIPSKPFYHIEEIDDISVTPPNAALFVHFSEANLDIIIHLQAHELTYAMEVTNLSELLYAHHFGAKYIVVSDVLAKSAQNIAENYLFDAKVLCRVKSDAEIEEKIVEGIDGVIYTDAIIKAGS